MKATKKWLETTTSDQRAMIKTLHDFGTLILSLNISNL